MGSSALRDGFSVTLKPVVQVMTPTTTARRVWGTRRVSINVLDDIKAVTADISHPRRCGH